MKTHQGSSGKWPDRRRLRDHAKQEATIDTETGFLFCPGCTRVVLEIDPNAVCPQCGCQFLTLCRELAQS